MRFSVLASAVFGLFLCVTNANAADYAIAPFKVNGSKSYEYLKNAIPPMLNSRLFTAGTNEPVANQDTLYQATAPTSKQNAEKLRQQYKADYLIYGSVNVIGEQASLDINVIGKNNFSWQGSDNNSVHNLLASVENIANTKFQPNTGKKISLKGPVKTSMKFLKPTIFILLPLNIV